MARLAIGCRFAVQQPAYVDLAKRLHQGSDYYADAAAFARRLELDVTEKRQLLMRLADLRLAMPFVLLVISVIAVFGPSFTNLIVILGLTGWVPYAKIVRAEALSMREREFIVAARAVGATNTRLMFRHILPNTVAAAIVIGSLELANIIVIEASLSFLGLGVQAPTPSWGNMLGESRDYLMSNFWLATLPGIMISVTAISVNLIGDWLRDILDPRIQT